MVELRDQLLELEGTLWRSETRFDVGYMDPVLHPSFFEFGRSGRTYTREDALNTPPASINATLHDFNIHPLTDV